MRPGYSTVPRGNSGIRRLTGPSLGSAGSRRLRRLLAVISRIDLRGKGASVVGAAAARRAPTPTSCRAQRSTSRPLSPWSPRCATTCAAAASPRCARPPCASTASTSRRRSYRPQRSPRRSRRWTPPSVPRSRRPPAGPARSTRRSAGPARHGRGRPGRLGHGALGAGAPGRAVRPGRAGRVPVERGHERRAGTGRRGRLAGRGSPPQKEFGGLPHPSVLAACALLGVDEVYAVGGAQAVAMFAWGTEDCPAVDLVHRSRQRLRRGGEADLHGWSASTPRPARPNPHPGRRRGRPRYVAADLISQAEHDPNAALRPRHRRAALADAVNRAERSGRETKHATGSAPR